MSEAKVFIAPDNVRNVTANQNKKVVYKSVVNSPFMLKWPTVKPDLGQTIITQLIKVLEPLGEYRKACKEIKKKAKRKTKTDQATLNEPDLSKRTVVGINEVTKKIEKYTEGQLLENRMPVIFICKREIKPLQLCQHLLYMAALAKIILVPLPADSEVKLSKALGLNRASVVLLEIMENKEEALRLSTKDIPVIDAPWLSNALLNQDKIQYKTTDTVKTLKTSITVKGKTNAPVKRKASIDESSDSAKKVKV